MKRSLVLACLLAGGCARYAQIKLDLNQHALRSIEQLEFATDERQSLVENLIQQQRARLDAAFDADVLQNDTLSPQWVMDARKAYAMGIDAIHAQRAAALRAHDAMLQHLAAARLAIQQNSTLLRIEQQLDPFHRNQP